MAGKDVMKSPPLYPGAHVPDQVDVMRQLMIDGIANGEVQPLVSTVFSEAHAEDAFRYLSKGERTQHAPQPDYATAEC